MEEIYNDTNEQIEASFFPVLFSFFKEEIAEQRKFVKDAEDIYDNFSDRLAGDIKKHEELRVIKEINNTNNKLYDLLSTYYPEKKENRFIDDFKTYINFCNKELQKIPAKITVAQKKERFEVLESDTLSVKLRKPIKRLFYKLSKTPLRIANTFRKDKKEEKMWTHHIPLRRLYANFFEFQFPYSLIEEYAKLLSSRTETIDQVWKIDQHINKQINLLTKDKITLDDLKAEVSKRIATDNFNLIYNSIDELEKFLEREIKLKLKLQINAYRETFDRVGTMELAFNTFTETKIKNTSESLQINYLKLSNGWKNTLFAMLDDFQLDLELYHIIYTSLQQGELLQNSCETRINSNIIGQVSEIKQQFINTFDRIKDSKQTETIDDFSSFLIVEKEQLSHLLTTNIIPESIDKLYNQNIPYLIDRLELKIKNEIEKIKTPRIIAGTADYTRAFKKTELEHFNPKSLVLIGTFPKFQEKTKKLKTEILKQLEDARTSISDINSIVTYNLDSAITFAKDGKDFDAVKDLAIEGMERSISKAEEIISRLRAINNLINNSLKTSIDEINTEIDRLTTNENILNLKISLAKAKALKKTKNYKEVVFAEASKIFLKAKAIYKLYSHKIIVWYDKTLIKFGLAEKEQKITAALADFLVETENAIQKLPYVYQRLYRIEPIDDESFFVGRLEEMKALNDAYNNWKNGRYSATVLVGEKGSGASTSINFFIKNNVLGDRVKRIKLNKAIFSQKDLIVSFNEIFDLKTTTIEELSDQLIKKYKDSILILEDINYLFLREVNGFQAIKSFLEILSKTGKEIFWLNSCKLYAWNYLNKTLLIESYYRNVVTLKALDEKQIINVILSRHRVSGYNIQFEFEENTKNAAKLNKISEEEQQEALKNDFFKQLNKFSDSNLSLALLYWLRSTKKVENNTIYIGNMIDFDFSFLKKLSMQPIFTLQALILHENLSIDEHAHIFNQTILQSRMELMVLEDRGLINQNEQNEFTINQLLYRQVVNLLKNKNFIH